MDANALRSSFVQRFRQAATTPAALAIVAVWIAACSPRHEPADRTDKTETAAASAPTSTPTIDPNDAANYRFLYAVYCNGRVDKLDLHTKQKLLSFELSERSGTPPGVAARPQPGVKGDACLARPVASVQTEDMARGQVRVVASGDLYRSNETGQQPFQLLTFVLPDWKLVGSLDLGRFDTLNATPPYLAPDAAGALKPQTDPARRLLADVSGYQGMLGLRAHEVIERSGDKVLINVEDKTAKSALPRAGIAHEKERRLVRLADPPNALSGVLRLAPGGSFVMRQINESKPITQKSDGKTSTALRVNNSGELRLYDAQGQVVATVVDKTIAGGWHCIALTPNGLAVYTDRRGGYRFVPLGRRFENALVWDSNLDDEAGARPGLVYSAR